MRPDILVIDFETKSRVDLKTAGTDIYASDPSTDILCMCAAFSNTPDKRWKWRPADGPLSMDFQAALVKHLRAGGLVAAVNARFDRLVWEFIGGPDYAFPEIPFDRWYCISAQCRVNGLPASLDNAARALGTPHQKNPAGDRLIRELCIPNKDTGKFNDDPQKHEALLVYCVDDVLASIDVMNMCRLLNEKEHKDWLANERINDFGVHIDTELATLAKGCAAVEAEALGKELADITGGLVTKHTQNQRLKKWMLPRLSPEAEKLTVVYKDGQRKNSLAKDIRANLLTRADEGALTLSDEVYDAILALDEGNKSSVSKFTAMLGRADPEDERVRGAFIYAGAGTLRYTSRGLQLHNMRRDVLPDEQVDEAKRMMRAGHKPSVDTVMDHLSRMLRPAIIPAPGNVLVVGDWKAIENRVLPWLSGDPRAEKKLDIFRNGGDPYIVAAQDAGGYDRQVGKVIELSLGFGGAVGAFNSMAKNYRVFLPEAQVRQIVDRWRMANPWARDFWNALEAASKAAIRNPGQTFKAGRVEYVFVPGFLQGALMCKLPDGQYLTYPAARIETVTNEWGTSPQVTALKANWKPAADEKEWPRFKLWGGLLSENITQAFAGCLLRDAILECHGEQLDVAAHCHDELVSEVQESEGEIVAGLLQEIMETPPAYAKGLPLDAPCSIMKRYGKA